MITKISQDCKTEDIDICIKIPRHFILLQCQPNDLNNLIRDDKQRIDIIEDAVLLALGLQRITLP